MAIDTAAKRQSALSWGQPWRTVPLPAGSIGQGARQAVALCYSGILAGAAIPLLPSLCIDLPNRSIHLDLPRRTVTLDLTRR